MKMKQGRRQGRSDSVQNKSFPLLQFFTGALPATAGVTPLRLDMEVKNFGPIKKGTISLRPLTILIGPSNTGKSYAAMLAHSIISSSRGIARRHIEPASIPDQNSALNKLAIGMRDVLLGMTPEKSRKCPPAISTQIMKLCKHALTARLKSEIELNFASPLCGMIRHKTNRFSISLKNNGKLAMTYGGGRLVLGSMPNIDIVLHPTEVDDGTGYLKVTGPDEKTIHCRVNRDLIASEIGIGMSERLYQLIEEKAMPRMIPGLPVADFYFPAARTGILQAHRVISSAIIKSAPYGGTEDIQVPRLSGVVSDFVSAIIDMYPVRGPYFDIGSRIESDVLGGHVNLKYSDQRTFPELVYRQLDGDVPVHRASSTISELAPLTLFLKHRILRGSMLVVEEPEAHLHPSKQIQLAGHIVRLVRNGVNVMITTHSATLFESIGQYLEVSAMSPKSRKRALGADDLYLCTDEVAPHLFMPEGKGGSVAKKIDVSAKDGISQDEFVKVDQMLSENNARIEEYSG